MPIKTNMAVINPAVNDAELIEEELDGTSKKRSRSADTEIKNTTPSDTTGMEDMQLTKQQHNTTFFIGRVWFPGLPDEMSILCWNCRGLGHPKAVPSLKDLIRVYKPDIFFLIETLSHSNKIREVCYLLGYDSYFTVDRDGRSGGLAVIWKSSIQCNIINYSSNFINLQVYDSNRGNWRLTSFWGYSNHARRRQSWNLLRDLAAMSTDPWCIGDFNDLLTSDDKLGGSERPTWLYNGFRSAVNDCNLHDLPLEGYPFTWFKSLGTPHAIEERLDKAFHTSS